MKFLFKAFLFVCLANIASISISVWFLVTYRTYRTVAESVTVIVEPAPLLTSPEVQVELDEGEFRDGLEEHAPKNQKILEKGSSQVHEPRKAEHLKVENIQPLQPPVGPQVPVEKLQNDRKIAIKPLPKEVKLNDEVPKLDKVEPPANVKPPPTEVKPPPANVKPPPAEVKPPPAEVKPPPAEVKPPPAEVKPPPAEVKPPPAEVKPPPAEVKPRPAEVHHPFSAENALITVNAEVTDDVMPAYFNMSQTDMLPQYEKYINQTKAIMDARVARVKERCGEKKKSGSSNFLYSFPNGLRWCAVFKAGSTNWKQFFCKLYSPASYEEAAEKAKQLDLTANIIEPYCNLGVLRRYGIRRGPAKRKGAIQFLTVRHPYERLVSAYTNKFKDCKSLYHNNRQMIPILREFRAVNGTDIEKKAWLEQAKLECSKPISERVGDVSNPYMKPWGVTFPEFVRYVVKEHRAHRGQDPHWMPAANVCNMCDEEYDVIQKFETLERDRHYLFHEMGHLELLPLIANRHDYPTDWVHKSEPTPVQDYFISLDKTLLWYLESFYKKDLELFGYKPHVYVSEKLE